MIAYRYKDATILIIWDDIIVDDGELYFGLNDGAVLKYFPSEYVPNAVSLA